MTKLDLRYAASASLAQHGVELIAVHDSLGARFDAATRDLIHLIQRDGPGVWDDLAGATKSLRWRLITDPLPVQQNLPLQAAAQELVRQATRLQAAVTERGLLDKIVTAANDLLTRDPPTGSVIVESLKEIGADHALVIAASSRSREVLSYWLRPVGARVLTVGDLERADITEDIAYFVGPPRFFKPTAVTAPRTAEVTFVVPAWFGDRSVPKSAIAPYAEGGIEVAIRLIEVDDPDELELDDTSTEVEPIPEEELLPQPSWGSRISETRAPTADEVEARKILLSGGRAIWLEDDGERIRALDPTQPVGERVGYIDVSAVTPGTYLLLREGAAESESLRAKAFERIGGGAASIRDSQAHWKSVLMEHLRTRGGRELEHMLRALDVQAAGQVRAWASPHLIRPQNDDDFERLLALLGLPAQPYLGNASTLRKEVHRASRELRERLERAADVADLHELEQVGHMTLDITELGFRGMFATRVLATAPFTELVARHEARVPFDDGGARWLE